jgi:hypothetical protein
VEQVFDDIHPELHLAPASCWLRLCTGVDSRAHIVSVIVTKAIPFGHVCEPNPDSKIANHVAFAVI